MTILADIIAANIIVEPTTGDIDLIVDQPVVIVDAPALGPVIVEVAGAPGETGRPGDPGPPGPTAVSADAGNTATLGSDSLLYVPAPAPSLTWTPLVLKNGWAAYDGIRQCRYRVTDDGQVIVQGLIRGGVTGTTAFSLPYPESIGGPMAHPVVAYMGIAQVQVLPNGDVNVYDMGNSIATEHCFINFVYSIDHVLEATGTISGTSAVRAGAA